MSVEEYNTVFKTLRQFYDDHTEKIATLEKENASLKEENVSLKKKKDLDAWSVQTRLGVARTKLAFTELDLDKFKKENATLIEVIASSKKEIASLEEENATLKKVIASPKKENVSLKEENASLHEGVKEFDLSNLVTPSCKELAKKEPKPVTKKEIDPNRKILRSILKQISKLREAVKSPISEMCSNRLEIPHLELRKEILEKMRIPVETNKNIYLPEIFSNQSLTEDDCKMFISRGRILEKAYLMILEVYKICNEEDDDVFATLHHGRRSHEDFYAKLTSSAGILDERTTCVTYFRSLLGHGRYQCYDSSDSEDEELPSKSYDGKEIISFRHTF